MTTPAAIADEASENRADCRDGQGLPQDHRDDAVGPRAKRHPNRDLPPSHRDAIGGHSVEADAGEQERHDAQDGRRPRQPADDLSNVRESAGPEWPIPGWALEDRSAPRSRGSPVQGGRPDRRRGRESVRAVPSWRGEGKKMAATSPEEDGFTTSSDVVDVALHGRFHDSHDPDLGLRFPDQRCRHTEASAECRAARRLSRKVFGDDRHLGDVAPVRRDEFAALHEVEPQDLEEVAFCRRRAHEKARSVGPTDHAARRRYPLERGW